MLLVYDTIFVNMSDVDEEEFMCGDDEEYDLVNSVFTFAHICVHTLCSVKGVLLCESSMRYSNTGVDKYSVHRPLLISLV